MLFLMYIHAMPYKPLNIARQLGSHCSKVAYHDKIISFCMCMCSLICNMHMECPCDVALMVTQECRVYINEMINFLVLSTNRYLL